MNRARLFAFAVIALSCWSLDVATQVSTPQIPTGTAMPGVAPPVQRTAPDRPSTLRGRVISAETGKALHRARVRLNHLENGLTRDALTDRDGGYGFDNLPPGFYRIRASHPGFIEMRPGQKHPNDVAGPIWKIEAGEVQQLDFALPRGSVLSGRISDDAGEPLAGAQVVPLRLSYSSSGASLSPLYVAPFNNSTDDRGEFRIPGLTPGTYVISASIPRPVIGESYATTYYPGTKNLSEAQRFKIGLNEQITASFSMTMTRQVRVTGQVRSARGEVLKDYRAVLSTETGLGSTGPQIREGNFEFSGVAPGLYTLNVTTSPNDMLGPGRSSEFASVPIEIGDEDISGLLITTGSGVTLSGRVVFDGAAPKNAVAEHAHVSASIVKGRFPFRRPSTGNNGAIAGDGSFRIANAYGKVLFMPFAPGWQLKSVMLDGVDITDVPYDTSRGGTDRLEIVMTDEKQGLTGRVVDARGRPPGHFVVLTFPRTVRPGTLPNRYLGMSANSGTNYGSGSDGTFRLMNLPPGEYFAAALGSLPENAQFDVEFHESIKSRATPFEVLPGRTVHLEFMLIE